MTYKSTKLVRRRVDVKERAWKETHNETLHFETFANDLHEILHAIGFAGRFIVLRYHAAGDNTAEVVHVGY